ncbi:MAG: pyridoxal phosphate-dependent aminotransferase family protein [Parachlamydiaceae bacterium]|nr:pyridoxal phosphate-dependent aminotransferase family protein [Parachlamydiaceae bacterium]
MTQYLQEQLMKRKHAGNLRELKVTQNLVDFSSNDYLGLARSTKLKELLLQEWQSCNSPLNGLGSTGSRLLTGNSPYIQELENRIAAFHGYEAGLLFNCGYMANSGLLSTVAGSQDSIFFDAAVHASTREGLRLSQAKAYPFRHNCLEHLENRLKNSRNNGDRFVCIESIYSTDGSKAPLKKISQLVKRYNAHLIVDEAHAVGIFGQEGRGLVAEEHLTSDVFAQIVTFGKALGTYGAIILGSKILKKGMINFAPSYIYTTALPFHAVAAIKCSYDLFPSFETERSHLQELIRIFTKLILNKSTTPIQAINVKGNEAVKLASRQLIQLGFDVRPLTSPTVKQGNEVLRICLHAFNTEEEINNLCKHIKQRISSHA